MNLDELHDAMSANDPDPGGVLAEFKRKQRRGRQRMLGAGGGLAVVIVLVVAGVAIARGLATGTPVAAGSSSSAAAGGARRRRLEAAGAPPPEPAGRSLRPPARRTALRPAQRPVQRVGRLRLVGKLRGQPAEAGHHRRAAPRRVGHRRHRDADRQVGDREPGHRRGSRLLRDDAEARCRRCAARRSPPGRPRGSPAAPGASASVTSALLAPGGRLFAIVSPKAGPHDLVGPTLRLAPIVGTDVVFTPAGCWDVTALQPSQYQARTTLKSVPDGAPFGGPNQPAENGLYAVPLATVEQVAAQA